MNKQSEVKNLPAESKVTTPKVYKVLAPQIHPNVPSLMGSHLDVDLFQASWYHSTFLVLNNI